LLKRVWDGVTSAVGSDARKRDDGDAKASSRSDETSEWALDAPYGSGEISENSGEAASELW